MLTRFLRLTLLVVAAVVVAVVLAGCGSSSSSTSSSSTTPSSAGGTGDATFGATKDSSIAAMVPSKYQSGIEVASDASYAPMEYIDTDGSTVIGADVDLGKAIGTIMGVPMNFKNVTFDAIIPGLAADKYGLGMSSFTDTLERQQTVDFVTYYSAGTSFYTKASGGPDIQTLADLCGQKVAVETGTTEQTDAEAQSKKCTNSGKAAVALQTYPTQNAANLALSSSKADVGMADSPVAAYIAQQSNGQFKVSGQPYGTAPYGIAIPKNSGLSKPVLAAVKKLIADGAYAKILAKWDLSEGAISNPGINQATS